MIAVLAFVVFYRYADADLATLSAVRRMPFDAFKGSVVWITGASSGIGEALAYELAGRQATLILSARRMDRLLAVAQRCGELGAADAYALRLDVEAFSSHAPAVASVLARYGRIDVLVNNAGRSQRALVESTPIAVDQAMLSLNVIGPLSLTKAVLPAMLAAGRGTIANTASVAGKVGAPISASYSCSKFALIGWSDALRSEVGSRGIHVVNVCPGPVASHITENAFSDDASGKALGSAPDDGSFRMSAERCALLMAAAIHARLPESWIAPQPILLFTYIGQYLPSVLMQLSHIVGARRVAAFKAGINGYSSMRNPFAIFSGLFFKKKA